MHTSYGNFDITNDHFGLSLAGDTLGNFSSYPDPSGLSLPTGLASFNTNAVETGLNFIDETPVDGKQTLVDVSVSGDQPTSIHLEHHNALQAHLRLYGIDFAFSQVSVTGTLTRYYSLPRAAYRTDLQAIRNFHNAFDGTWYRLIKHDELFLPQTTMSVAFEARSLFPDHGYPTMDDHAQDHAANSNGLPAFDDADVNELAGVADYDANATLLSDSDARIDLAAAEMDKEVSPAASTPSIPDQRPEKPNREVQKNAHGLYACTWRDCNEVVREFSRKCEWNKHMDKHERPYRCLTQGCEKLPGFTYSGGLLRHEREVHKKHGGPKAELYCPHPHCKRHHSAAHPKGFSRQENLTEHIRRCHQGIMVASDALLLPSSPTAAFTNGANGSSDVNSDDGASTTSRRSKRKRDASSVGGDDESPELKRLKIEVADLKKQVEGQNAYVAMLLGQIANCRQNHPKTEALQQVPAQAILPSNAPAAQML